MTDLDPRINAYRDDLADLELEGEVLAQKYVTGETFYISSPSSFLKTAPDEKSIIVTQALCGEEVTIFEMKEGWAWGQLSRDRYVGYLHASDAHKGSRLPKAKVIVKHTHIYPEPNIKSHPELVYHLGAILSGSVYDDTFFKTDDDGYVIRSHLAPLDMIETDYVSVAESFKGTPYLWGGKTGFGLDCSGLVQISLQASGVESPRDSDMQAAILGSPLDESAWSNLKRGDLVFWKGHVGIMCDEVTLLHANGHHMMVVQEPLAQASERIASEYGNITQVNRF